MLGFITRRGNEIRVGKLDGRRENDFSRDSQNDSACVQTIGNFLAIFHPNATVHLDDGTIRSDEILQLSTFFRQKDEKVDSLKCDGTF